MADHCAAHLIDEAKLRSSENCLRTPRDAGAGEGSGTPSSFPAPGTPPSPPSVFGDVEVKPRTPNPNKPLPTLESAAMAGLHWGGAGDCDDCDGSEGAAVVSGVGVVTGVTLAVEASDEDAVLGVGEEDSCRTHQLQEQ